MFQHRGESEPAAVRPSESAGEVTQRSVDAAARRLRADWAAGRAASYLSSYDPQEAASLVEGSPFAGHVLNIPTGDPLLLVAFNLTGTLEIVEELVADILDPEELVFTVARVCELGLYSLHDPNAPHRSPLTYLGASKHWGYFFTPPDVSRLLAERAIGARDNLGRVLDPAAGCGSLVAAVIIAAAKGKATIESVTAVELDALTASVCALVLRAVLDRLDLSFPIEVIQADAVDVLSNQVADGTAYDCIVMNPPYGRAKFLRSVLTNAETRVAATERTLDEQSSHWRQLARERSDRLRRVSRALGHGGGAQDFQRVFIGLGMAALAPQGRFAFIASSAWLGDVDSRRMRESIVEERLLEEVTLYPEGSALFATVNQQTAVAVLSRDSNRRSFEVGLADAKTHFVTDRYRTTFARLRRLDPERLRIPRLASEAHEVLETLQRFPKVRDIPWLKNARGELDLTVGRDMITSRPGPLRLVRGDHVERYVLRREAASKRDGYVDEDRLLASPAGKKSADRMSARIVGRQVSYLNKRRRLSFTIAPPGAVVANSCNYLSVRSPEDREIRLRALTTLLNSSVMEWYFRVFNSNNHVANYEIDDLPVCLDSEGIQALANHAKCLLDVYAASDEISKSPSAIEDGTDALVAYLFGLNARQTLTIMESVDRARAPRVARMVEWFTERGLPAELVSGAGWFLHREPQLSALDREMIRHVPQGGNWRDIPDSVPSDRLKQIRAMAQKRGIVRTTYYGRLRPDQPAYTIATYYNRPGNGTNIHPWEDRTISSREAARLQSFPDWYVFLGPEASIRKQIGNAVPPLLAYAIGRHLFASSTGNACVDLFAGAGGLSLGLEFAGWSVLAAVDNDPRAADTYQINRPMGDPFPADSAEWVFNSSDLGQPEGRAEALAAIRANLGGQALDLLVGGPPCQGFSHAGWRSAIDQRNDLAAVFMGFVKELEPNLVLLENVDGLLTYGGGRVVRDLIRTLQDLGYDTGSSPWLLRAEQFGVPQMRRRVFLVGTRRGTSPSPPPAQFQQCFGRRETAAQIAMFQELPYPVTVAEAIRALPLLGPVRHADRGSRQVRPAYAAWASGSLGITDLGVALSQDLKGREDPKA